MWNARVPYCSATSPRLTGASLRGESEFAYCAERRVALGKAAEIELARRAWVSIEAARRIDADLVLRSDLPLRIVDGRRARFRLSREVFAANKFDQIDGIVSRVLYDRRWHHIPLVEFEHAMSNWPEPIGPVPRLPRVHRKWYVQLGEARRPNGDLRL